MVAKMEDKNLAHITLPVQGMTCAACVAKVEKSLRSISGVDEVNVNLLSSKVAVSYDKDKTGAPQMVKTIQEIGYEVPEEEVLLTVRGMTCASCVAKVEKVVKGLPGVTSVVVNLPAYRVGSFSSTATMASNGALLT